MQQQAVDLPRPAAAVDPNASVRPKDAVISCSHFWAYTLLVAGLAGFIVGTITLSEWKGLGSFWVGAMAIGAGVAGLYVSQSETSGGMATWFSMFLSFFSLVAATLCIALGEGVAYLVVKATEGNCQETDGCPDNGCDDDYCVCWKPDVNLTCSEPANMRYCIRYGGDKCSDIKDSEGLLLASSVLLFIIAILSLSSIVVAVNTYWFCKRVIVVESSASTDEAASFH